MLHFYRSIVYEMALSIDDVGDLQRRLHDEINASTQYLKLVNKARKRIEGLRMLLLVNRDVAKKKLDDKVEEVTHVCFKMCIQTCNTCWL